MPEWVQWVTSSRHQNSAAPLPSPHDVWPWLLSKIQPEGLAVDISTHEEWDRPPPELLLISRRTQQGSWRRRRAAWAEGGDRALGRVFSRSSGCLRACGQQQEHHRWSLAIGIEVGDRARVSPAEVGSRASEEHLLSHGRSTQIARSWRESARHLPCRCRSTMSTAA